MIPFSVFSDSQILLMLINKAFPWDNCAGELEIIKTKDGKIRFETDQDTEHTIGAFTPSESIEEAEMLARQGVMVIDADKILQSMEPEYQNVVIDDIKNSIERNLLVGEIIGRIWFCLDDPYLFYWLPLKLYCPHVPVQLVVEDS